MQIDGAVALVTGGASGLGLTIARQLEFAGSIVVAVDRDEAALDRLPPTIEAILMDVTIPKEVQRTVANIVGKHGQIDILVNNAGVIFSKPFVNIMNPDGIMHDYDSFKSTLDANLNSVFLVTSAVVEQMIKKRNKGTIINISSISAHGNEGQTAYAAAKAGVNALTVTWAKELGRWGIRSNAVAPGFIDTGSTQNALHKSVLDHVQKNTPLQRLGNADEVAHAVIALAENDFINGAILDVNGGLTI